MPTRSFCEPSSRSIANLTVPREGVERQCAVRTTGPALPRCGAFFTEPGPLMPMGMRRAAYDATTRKAASLRKFLLNRWAIPI